MQVAEAAVAAALARFGRVDVLVNVAAIETCSHTHEITLADWNRIIAVNLTGTFLMTRQALPALLESGRGVVINFTSTSASYASSSARWPQSRSSAACSP